MINENFTQTENIAKQILDKWAVKVVSKDAVFLNNDVAQVNSKKIVNYTESGYKGSEVLWIPPNNCFRAEFEDDTKINNKYIAEMESNAKALGFDYCITGHNGHSDYFNMFNIGGMPMTNDNQAAKLLLADLLMPKQAKDQLDRTNLGRTLSPIIEHPHWKPKYNGNIHKILRGKNPLEHNNKYPKELLKQLNKSTKINSAHIVDTIQNNKWVSEFLLNYCCNNILPKGARHYVIEKNLSAFIIHRKDKIDIKKKYLNAQQRKHDSLITWEMAILKGDYTNVSAGELYNFIKEYDIPFQIKNFKKENKELTLKLNTTEKNLALEVLKKTTLFDNITIDEFNKTVVGEIKSRKAIFLSRCAIWVKDLRMNTIVGGESASGKDYTVKSISSIFPKNTLVYRTRISPKVFTYWHKDESDWDWTGKNLCLTDVDDSVINDPVFKVMLSEGTDATITVKNEAVDIHIPGIPNVIITSAEANPTNQILTRLNMISMDESSSQTVKIMEYGAKLAEDGLLDVYDKNIINALSLLKRYDVLVPYASKLIPYFPTHVKMRRIWKNFIGFIQSSAALHQYQRDKDVNGKLIANQQDYEIARDVIESIKRATITGLTSTDVKYLKIFTKLVKNNKSKIEYFSVKEIASETGYKTEESWRNAVKSLSEKNLLLTHLDHETFKPITRYSIKPFNQNDIGLSLPEFNELISEKDGKLAENLEIKKIESKPSKPSLDILSKPSKPSKPSKI